MPYFQEGCDVDIFAYISMLKPNISNTNMRETLVIILAPVDLLY
jgi:hypothetical protein